MAWRTRSLNRVRCVADVKGHTGHQQAVEVIDVMPRLHERLHHIAVQRSVEGGFHGMTEDDEDAHGESWG